MTEALLTIIVPTYKRSANLELLLRTLREETISLGNDVMVFVVDNASPDDTPQVIARAAENWPTLLSHRHAANIGAENNFCYGVRAVRSRWFWIIGDDDLPKRGIIAKVVALLRERQPALVYLQSEWVNPVHSADQGKPVNELQIADLDALTFAKTLHTWLTFISGIVIDRQRLEAALQGQPIDRFNDSAMVQLGWVLPLLNTTGPFVFIKDQCLLATSGNTGGYSVLTTFCVNFPKIIQEFFAQQPSFSRAILNRHIKNYLPGLIWAVRSGSAGDFKQEDANELIRQQLGGHIFYWLLVWPIKTLPLMLAWPFYALSRVIAKLTRTA